MREQLAWQGWLTTAVIAATLALLLWERSTPDKVLAAAAATLLFSGVLTPVQALAGFRNPGVLKVALLFVLVAALKNTGAIRCIGDRVLERPRDEFHAQSRLVGIAAPLSVVINNTAIVAMMTSAVEHWSRRSGIVPSKLLMPMNDATIGGRICTQVGTRTNLIVSGLGDIGDRRHRSGRRPVQAAAGTRSRVGLVNPAHGCIDRSRGCA